MAWMTNLLNSTPSYQTLANYGLNWSSTRLFFLRATIASSLSVRLRSGTPTEHKEFYLSSFHIIRKLTVPILPTCIIGQIKNYRTYAVAVTIPSGLELVAVIGSHATRVKGNHAREYEWRLKPTWRCIDSAQLVNPSNLYWRRLSTSIILATEIRNGK